jgi:hypothetical protein
VHAPNVEAVILRGNEHELAGYMLTGRESGMIDFLTALKSVQHLVEPSDYQLFFKAVRNRSLPKLKRGRIVSGLFSTKDRNKLFVS